MVQEHPFTKVVGGKHEYCWRHGARGVRTAVCVRDGRSRDPKLIARFLNNPEKMPRRLD
jgi:hypothetical protein